jgi:hypothetical protein
VAARLFLGSRMERLERDRLGPGLLPLRAGMLASESGGAPGLCGRFGLTRNHGGHPGRGAPALDISVERPRADERNARRPGSGLLRPRSGARLGDAGGRPARSRSEHRDAILHRPGKGACRSSPLPSNGERAYAFRRTGSKSTPAGNCRSETTLVATPPTTCPVPTQPALVVARGNYVVKDRG